MSITERVSTFFQSVLAESRKVTWPSREELRESTTVVLGATAVVMLYLFVVDRVLTFLLDLVF